MKRVIALTLFGVTLLTLPVAAKDRLNTGPALMISDYYEKLSEGMNRRDIGKYWTKKMGKRFDDLVEEFSLVNEVNTSVERQRLLDLAMMEARCEHLEPIEKNKSMNVRQLKYSVTYMCSPNIDIPNRTISVVYSNTDKRWLIDRIDSEGERYEF